MTLGGEHREASLKEQTSRTISRIQLRDFPIAETDEEGNTYQHRVLKDGSTHRVLKNFPSEAELAEVFAPWASAWKFQQRDNFWLFEYELA
jgi:demethylmenaquinone methyltransferase/2-methoxy-6-polyprenyl-1,4-benzoquinol methylase